MGLSSKKRIECEELSLKNSCEQVESLFRDWGNKGNLVVDSCYRLPDKGEPINEAFLVQPWRQSACPAGELQPP